MTCKQYVATTRRRRRLLSRFNSGKRTNESTKPAKRAQCRLTDEVTRFGGNNVQESADSEEREREGDRVAALSAERVAAGGYDRRAGGGGCS